MPRPKPQNPKQKPQERSENTGLLLCIYIYILGLSRDNGKEYGKYWDDGKGNGNYYNYILLPACKSRMQVPLSGTGVSSSDRAKAKTGNPSMRSTSLYR